MMLVNLNPVTCNSEHGSNSRTSEVNVMWVSTKRDEKLKSFSCSFSNITDMLRWLELKDYGSFYAKINICIVENWASGYHMCFTYKLLAIFHIWVSVYDKFQSVFLSELWEQQFFFTLVCISEIFCAYYSFSSAAASRQTVGRSI